MWEHYIIITYARQDHPVIFSPVKNWLNEFYSCFFYHRGIELFLLGRLVYDGIIMKCDVLMSQ
jgi:hypothetical protein